MFSFRLNTLSLIQGFIFSFPSRVCVYSCRAFLFAFFHFVLAWVSLPRSLLFWVWVISQFEASLFFPLTAKLEFEKLFCFFVSVHAFCSLTMYKQTGQLSYSRWCTGCWLVMARRCGLAGFCSWDLLGPFKWVQSSCVGALTVSPWAVFCGLDFPTYPWSLHFLLAGTVSFVVHGSSSSFPPQWEKEEYTDTYQGAFLQLGDTNENAQKFNLVPGSSSRG